MSHVLLGRVDNFYTVLRRSNPVHALVRVLYADEYDYPEEDFYFREKTEGLGCTRAEFHSLLTSAKALLR